jgi:hypothetical protein
MSAFAMTVQRCGATGGQHPDDDALCPPAEYIWTYDVPVEPELEIPLCGPCCARWRADAEKYPQYLTPRRIRSIPRSAISTAPAGSDPSDPDAWTPIGYADGVRIEWG